MGVTCQILISKSREGVYRPGDSVEGVVKYAIDEPTEYKDVSLSLLGQGKVSWSEDESNYYNAENYIQFHDNITNKRPEQIIILHGVYEHPFNFYIPDSIPTTFKDPVGSIIYFIQLKFVRPNLFSFNKIFTAQIPVYGSVDLLNPDGRPFSEEPTIFGLEKTVPALLPTRKPVIKMKAQIEKTRLTPGENAHLTCEVVNQSYVDVTGVKAELYCYTAYTANCGRTRKNCIKLKNCEVEMPGVPAGKQQSFAFVLPTLPECYSIQYSKIISKEYKVRVTVRLPMPRVNASAEIPVAIGERGGARAVDDSDLCPPSYYEAVCEEKEDDGRGD